MEACALILLYRKRCLHESQENVMIKFVNPMEGSVKELVLSKSCSPVILIYLESITDALERCPLRKIMNNRYC